MERVQPNISALQVFVRKRNGIWVISSELLSPTHPLQGRTESRERKGRGRCISINIHSGSRGEGEVYPQKSVGSKQIK